MKDSSRSQSFSEIEREAITLKIVVDSLNSCLTPLLFELRGKKEDATLYFHEELYQKYFYIVLMDFFSPIDANIIGEKLSCLDLISNICLKQKLGSTDLVGNLKKSTEKLQNWIKTEINIKKWFPDIDMECDLILSRKDILYICSNISKHNLGRLYTIAGKVRKIFRRSNVELSLDDALVLIYNFYEHFNDDVLNYHGSNIAEMINNILWGIHEYLQLEFEKMLQKKESQPFIYPNNLESKFAKECYWDLMSFFRTKPSIGKFRATRYLKMRY